MGKVFSNGVISKPFDGDRLNESSKDLTLTTIHSLLESLKSDQSFQKIYISQNRKGEKIEYIKQLCRQKRITFQMVPQSFIDRKTDGKNQGLFAQLSPIRFLTINDILKTIKTGLILILDRLTDTGNLGAIIRTAVAAQVDGIILPSRKSAPINETVLKTSAGSLIHARIVLSKNLANDIRI
ncbi:MAG: RNA methyltransferase [Candidatus Aminicenantes bacterium]|nr:RNA methyltransferase [Candidatus Aminicenantes bacterium]